MTQADTDAILKVLVDHGVDFVVIGASAAILQGAPIAATLDLDVSAAASERNRKRLADALRELDARLRVPDVDEGVPARLDARMLAAVSVVTMVTRHGPFDLIFAPAGAPSYAELKKRAVEVRPFDVAFKVASIEDLIAMKRAAGREKDAAHLIVLIEHLHANPAR